MLSPYITQYPGVEGIKDNLQYYFDEFEKNSVICFRGGNVSKEEQVEILKIFGDKAGWFPNTELLKDQDNLEAFNSYAFYSENHGHAYNENWGNDDIVITWHLEHFYRKNRTAGAVWNMKTFTCSTESGKTYFVDAHKLWQLLSPHEQQILTDAQTYFYYFDDIILADCASKHYRTGEILAHVDFNADLSQRHYLARYNGFSPSDTMEKEFNRIMMFLNDQVKNNEDIRIVHKWQQGDILIPDLFKLVHTITGGFKPEERYFDGVWATLTKPDINNMI
jgi:alpha-ketoglutarate-dependent taurine dioxygenase